MLQRLEKYKAGRMILSQVRQGTSPPLLSLTVTLGAVLGIIPVFGFITGVCAAVAAWLRLNVPLSIAVLYAVMPLQLLLFIPFIRLGEWLFPIEKLRLAPELLIKNFQQDTFGTLLQFWHSILGALGAWLLVSLLLGTLLYFVLLLLFRRFGSADK
ncbi:MAG: DUF2062 domain-containing protein [Cyclobacteriaceae bacterium]